ncbi:TRAP transporter small permease subunit [Arthrobacter sp. Sr33]
MSEQLTEEGGGRTRRAIIIVARVLAAISGLLIVLMMVSTVADVSRRQFLGEAIPGVIEMGEVLMVATVFLGLAYTEIGGKHVNMTLVIRKLPPRMAAIANTVGLLLVLFVVGWMVYVTGERAIEATEAQEYRFGLVQIPVWPARIALAVGLTAYFLALVARLPGNIRNITAPRQAPADEGRVA